MTRLVAVTGATGFIGQTLVPVLAARGHRLRLLVRSLPPLPPGIGPVELVIGDLRDPHALRRLVAGADVVVHLAGAIKALNPEAFHRLNADVVADLAAAMDGAAPDAHLLLLSSMAAREPHLSPYAASKRAGETALAALPPPRRWTAIRAPAVYGPGDRETLVFFKAIARGWMASPRGVAGRVSLIHVADLCAAVAATLDRPPEPGVYEIDDGAPGGHTLQGMAAVAADLLGARVRHVGVPRSVMGALAATQQLVARARGQAAILSAGKVRELFHPDWTVGDRRLAGWLGFAPAFDLKDGFADTIGWYRARGWLKR